MCHPLVICFCFEKHRDVPKKVNTTEFTSAKRKFEQFYVCCDCFFLFKGNDLPRFRETKQIPYYIYAESKLFGRRHIGTYLNIIFDFIIVRHLRLFNNV